MTKRTHILAAAGCGLALLLPGCGSDKEGKELPNSSVAALQNQLDSIEARVNAGACNDVTNGDDTNVDKVGSEIDSLPSDVDKDVRDALNDSFQRLFQLVQDECEQTNTETTPTETTPTVTETVPTETETVPTETTPTETTPTTPEKPKKNKKGKGGGGGAGSGGTQAEGGD